MRPEAPSDPVGLHRDNLVIDAHCDFLSSTSRDGRRFEARLDVGQVDLPRLLEGGVSAQVFAVFALPHRRPAVHSSTVEALRQIEAFHHLEPAGGGRFAAVDRADGIPAAKAAGKVGGLLALEGVEPLDGDLSLLSVFHRLGVRVASLTWNHANAAADGVGVATARGLTDFGRRVVSETYRLGILLDVAHLAAPGVTDVLRLAEGPVIASHANAFGLCPHPRNLTDAQLDGLARTGGVVCVTFVPAFVTSPAERSSLDGVLDHIDYLAHRIGTDHIGVGSDFDGYDGVTRGLEDVARWPALTAGLIARGYPAAAARNIIGLNLLRVFRQVGG